MQIRSRISLLTKSWGWISEVDGKVPLRVCPGVFVMSPKHMSSIYMCVYIYVRMRFPRFGRSV